MLVYLASTSPRRRALLSAAGIPFELVEPGHEPEGHGAPAELALQRAESKARGARVLAAEPGLVVGVDTVVEVDGRELGKPAHRAEAAEMLARLQGREHLVHSAIHVRPHPPGAEGRSALATAVVRMASLDRGQIERHAASELWRGKAGGYGIQDPDVAAFATVVRGDLDTVIGLPMGLLAALLAALRGTGR
jgi:septum formation protein